MKHVLLLAALLAGPLGCSLHARTMPDLPHVESPPVTPPAPPVCPVCGKHCSGIAVAGWCLPPERECGEQYGRASDAVECWRRKRLELVGHTDWSPYRWAQAMQENHERAEWEKQCWWCAWYITWPRVTPAEQAEWVTRLEKLMGVAE